MPAVFPWLPVGFETGDGGKICRVIDGEEGLAYQFCSIGGDGVCLLIKKSKCAANIASAAQDAAGKKFAEISFAGDDFLYATFTQDNAPMRVGSIPARPYFYSGNELCCLAQALTMHEKTAWNKCVYFPHTHKVLPFGKKDTNEERCRLAILLLTSGVSDKWMSPKQIRSINQWLTIAEINRFLAALALQTKEAGATNAKRVDKPVSSQDFNLPGQPKLQALFREVIDYYRQREHYEKMKVTPPDGMLLHGLPGVGKTYSVQKFADFTGWNLVEVGVGEVGSSYIHQTSKLIRRKFEEAKKRAPAVVFLDEIDALGASRENIHGAHKVEEVNELLKQVENAGKNGIFVVAATNRIENIDSALLRKGRFDRVVEVNFPSVTDIEEVLRNDLEQRPHAAGLNLAEIAEKMLNRPLSDVAYIINEAARLAVRGGKDKICQECLDAALQSVADKEKPGRFFL